MYGDVFVGDTGVVSDGFRGGRGAFLVSVGVFVEDACGEQNMFADVGSFLGGCSRLLLWYACSLC